MYTSIDFLNTTGLGGLAQAPQQPTPSGVVDLSKLPAGSSASYAGADWNTFMEDYGPLIEQQMASMNSTSLVDRARKDAAMVPGLQTGASDRALARRGGATATQRLSLAATRGYDRARLGADMVNNARVDQRQRNTDTALNLSKLGTDVYQMGLDNVRESEGLAASRRMNNAAAKQQKKQQLLGGALAIASMFL